MRIVVIVTTYNRPDALAAVLEGYLTQTDRDFEVVIADDGSTVETARVVRNYQAHAPFKVLHVWQEDLGFRAAAARNRALAATDAQYVVFTDGDCVPTPAFVAQHRALAEPGWFVAGNRILLSEAFTARVLREKFPIHAWRKGQWLRAWARRDANRILPLLELGNGAFRKHAPRKWEGAKTCNLAAWRVDLLRINGFDETYSGWGLEDSDLVIRLLHAGIRHKSGRFAVPLFHLWHRENDRSRLVENRRLLDELLTSQRIFAERGLNQYL
ncbi:MAG: glycosyltransferase family 2 protein [Pseudomonadota bacterium]|jgi:glycosyltransferase involved in cell wall biosynthesis